MFKTPLPSDTSERPVLRGGSASVYQPLFAVLIVLWNNIGIARSAEVIDPSLGLLSTLLFSSTMKPLALHPCSSL